MTDAARSLVVVADDGGVDAPRDEGILEAVDGGMVRAVALLAQGPHAERLAADLRRRPGVDAVLHLNLTFGAPLAGPAPTLTGRDGRFLRSKRAFWARAAAGRVDAGEVLREAAAQMALLREWGLRPVGVNGHNHVHLLPGVRDGVARLLAAEPGEPWVRVPAEAPPPPGTPPVCEPAMPCDEKDLDAPARALRTAGHPALAALRALAASVVHRLPGRVRFADAFLGCAFACSGSAEVLEHGLRAAEGPVVELMVHPGRRAPRSVPFSRDPRREVEREVLLSARLRDAVAAAGLTPRPFSAVPPA